MVCLCVWLCLKNLFMMWDKLNSLGRARTPFLFISDFEAKELIVIPLDEIQFHDIEFFIDENYVYKEHSHKLEKHPIEFEEYKKSSIMSKRRSKMAILTF